MTFEELVALISVKVEGDKELRDLRDNFKKTGESLKKNLSGNMQSARSKAFLPFQKGIKDTGNVIKSRLGPMAVAGGGLFKGLLMSTTALAGPLGVIAGIGATVAGVFAGIGASVATARREFQKTAEAAGTTAQVLDQNRAFIRLLGGKDEDALSISQALKKQQTEFLTGDKSAKERFNRLGVAATDQKGFALKDMGINILPLLKSFAKELNAIKGLRDTNDPRKANEANKRSIQLQKDANALGISGKLLSDIEGLSATQIDKVFFKSGSINPTLTDEQEENRKRLADEWNKLTEQLRGVWNAIKMPLAELGLTILKAILPALQAFADALIWAGKAIGLIKETRQEKVDRLAKEEDAAIEKRDKTRADFAAGNLPAYHVEDAEKEAKLATARLNTAKKELNYPVSTKKRDDPENSERIRVLEKIVNGPKEFKDMSNPANLPAMSPPVKNTENNVENKFNFKVDVTATSGPEIGQQIVAGARNAIDATQLSKGMTGGG